MIVTLADLVAPLDPASLLGAVTEKRWLKLRTSQAAGFRKLLPWQLFNASITLDAHARGAVRLLRTGREVPLELFSTRGGDGRRAILADAIHTLSAQGLSIQLLQAETFSVRIAALLASIERTLGIGCSANAYASFSRDGALPAHGDDHDVLVLQIDGTKRWTGYGGAGERPVGGGAAAVGEPDWEERLEPGDLLYLPRGEVHRAAVDGERSLHLTIALRPAQGRDTLLWLRDRSVAEAIFREDIMPFDAAEAGAERQRRLREALHQLVDRFDLDAMAGDRDAEATPFRPLNLGLADPFAPESWVAPSLRRRLRLPAEGGARVTLGTRTIALDATETAVLRRLLDCDAARVADLAAGPDREAILAATARLAQKSLVFVVDSES